MWIHEPPKPGSTWYVRYTRPGSDEVRIGPLSEESARGMIAEYSRSLFALSPVLEEWQPVNSWKRAE